MSGRCCWHRPTSNEKGKIMRKTKKTDQRFKRLTRTLGYKTGIALSKHYPDDSQTDEFLSNTRCQKSGFIKNYSKNSQNAKKFAWEWIVDHGYIRNFWANAASAKRVSKETRRKARKFLNGGSL